MNTEPEAVISEEETSETLETVQEETSGTLETFKTFDTFETFTTEVRKINDNEKSEGGAMEGLVLVNILEEILRMEAPKVMKGFDMCCCERCLCDVMALALNKIPAKYVVSKKGALFAKIASYGNQHRTDIFSSLTQACLSVKESPSHDS